MRAYYMPANNSLSFSPTCHWKGLHQNAAFKVYLLQTHKIFGFRNVCNSDTRKFSGWGSKRFFAAAQ